MALKDEVEREPVDAATAAVVVSMENLLLCAMCSCEEFVSPSLIPLATADIVDDVFRWRCISIGEDGYGWNARGFSMEASFYVLIGLHSVHFSAMAAKYD